MHLKKNPKSDTASHKRHPVISLVQIPFESRDKVLDKNSKTSELCLLSRKMTTLFLERDASVNFKY